MIVSKSFKTYLRVKRLQRGSYQFRKLMGINSEMLKKEESLINQLFQSLSFTRRDHAIAEKLDIKLSERELEEGIEYPKFRYENTYNKYDYFMQGNTENTSILFKVTNKNIPCWSFLERIFKNTFIYYFLFDISFFLSNKDIDDGYIIFGTEVGTWTDLAKIFVEEEHGSVAMMTKSREKFDKNLANAEKAIDIYCKEINSIKVKMYAK